MHAYRDTIVMNPGTMGNDKPMTYIRDLRYSQQLGFNLTSVLQTPAVGEQRFAVTEITTSEPEAASSNHPEAIPSWTNGTARRSNEHWQRTGPGAAKEYDPPALSGLDLT